jgi:hypothetical protein
MDKITTINDNMSAEETIREAKKFLGLSPEQSFQELEVEEENFDE